MVTDFPALAGQNIRKIYGRSKNRFRLSGLVFFRLWQVRMYEKIDLRQKLSVSGRFPALTGSGFGRFYCTYNLVYLCGRSQKSGKCAIYQTEMLYLPHIFHFWCFVHQEQQCYYRHNMYTQQQRTYQMNFLTYNKSSAAYSKKDGIILSVVRNCTKAEGAVDRSNLRQFHILSEVKKDQKYGNYFQVYSFFVNYYKKCMYGTIYEA
jgi:hypothetical protein